MNELQVITGLRGQPNMDQAGHQRLGRFYAHVPHAVHVASRDGQ